MAEIYPEESQRMGVISHLEELRKRILICLFFLAAVSAVFFGQGDRLMAIVKGPVSYLTENLIFIGPAEAFLCYVRISVTAGLIVSCPFILFQMWIFLKPALSSKTRTRFVLWLLMAAALFACGVLFTYYAAIPAALNFLIGFGRQIAAPFISLDQYVSFFCTFILIGGFIFEIPIMLVLLTDIGVLDPAFLEKKRPHALVLILVAAAVITPTQDVFNMAVFALPMYLLFEIGLLLSKIVVRRHRRRTAHGKEQAS